MFRSPHSPQAWVGFIVLWWGSLSLMLGVCKWAWAEWRRGLNRSDEVFARTHRVGAPRFDRPRRPLPESARPRRMKESA